MQRGSEQDDVFHLLRIKAGNTDSFELIYRRYFPRLYSFCMLLTHSKAEADEIVQETFIKLWDKRDQLDTERNFSAYLFTIARHTVYNRTAKRVREHALQVYYTNTQSDYSDITREEINYASMKKLLDDLVCQLPFMQKKVFTMSRVEGMTNQEIASRLQLSTSTVENHIHLALKSLKKHILRLLLLILPQSLFLLL